MEDTENAGTVGLLDCNAAESASVATGDADGYAWAWLLWRERRFMTRIVVAGVVVGVLLALLIPARYTAKAQLMPPDASGGGMLAAAMAGSIADKAGGLGTAAADLLGFKSSGALFAGILKSRSVQDRMVERFDLRRVYRKKYLVDARTELADRTEVVEDRKSGIISVSVVDRDRDRAQQMATAYVEELNRVVANSAMSAAGRERQFIEQQMAEVRKEMDSAAHDLADFSTKNGTVDLKEQARALLDAAASVQGELIAAQAELKGLRATYTDNNVRVRSADAKVTELTRQLRELGGSVGSARQPVGDYPKMRQLPQLGVTFEELYRRNKVANAVYEALVQQYELSKLQEAKDTPKVQMLDTPDRPELKSFPPRAFIVAGCTFLSLCFAGMWLIVADAWTRTDDGNSAKRLIVEMSACTAAHPIWRKRPVMAVRNACSTVVTKLSIRRRIAEVEGD